MWYGLPEPLEAFRFADDLSTSHELQTSRQLLIQFIQTLPTETGIPLSRTIVGGFSQGGAMAIDVGLDLPLAGLMVLSGYLHKSLQNIAPHTHAVLMVHGKQDPVVPLTAALTAKTALEATGTHVEYHAFDNMGHEISWAVLDRMQSFIQQQLQD
jgi:phospholipase/carboxylesterase